MGDRQFAGYRRQVSDRHPDSFRKCPTCGTAGALVDLVYTFEVCDCPLAEYAHLVEQIWHREHLVAVLAEQAATDLRERDRLVADGKRQVLAEAHKRIMREARRDPATLDSRQQVTYPGGLRRAARVVNDLLGDTLIELGAAERRPVPSSPDRGDRDDG